MSYALSYAMTSTPPSRFDGLHRYDAFHSMECIHPFYLPLLSLCKDLGGLCKDLVG